ncbi:hypothetical protein Hamer_G013106 [Homarus americanus]|uniref:Uncharacterized protein n=1 Tax=Homarus americanus TaxID=6706 RepID=A0A8J5MW57_HOMAM|nr:hypothetical protein Hamer_G013106 [Homarus americanus]
MEISRSQWWNRRTNQFLSLSPLHFNLFPDILADAPWKPITVWYVKSHLHKLHPIQGYKSHSTTWELRILQIPLVLLSSTCQPVAVPPLQRNLKSHHSQLTYAKSSYVYSTYSLNCTDISALDTGLV